MYCVNKIVAMIYCFYSAKVKQTQNPVFIELVNSKSLVKHVCFDFGINN